MKLRPLACEILSLTPWILGVMLVVLSAFFVLSQALGQTTACAILFTFGWSISLLLGFLFVFVAPRALRKTGRALETKRWILLGVFLIVSSAAVLCWFFFTM